MLYIVFNLLFFVFCGHDFNIIQTDSRLRFIFIDEFVILKQVKSFKSNVNQSLISETYYDRITKMCKKSRLIWTLGIIITVKQ